MSKSAKATVGDDNMTVSKIYQMLQSGPYLKSLYWDVLSDLKEKDTFKKMRKTIEKFLNKKTEELANLSDSESDNVKRKTTITEICSMGYTVDTVHSKILFVQLQKKFKAHIIEIIKDLRQERKIPDSVWRELQISDNTQVLHRPTENSPQKISPQPKPETSSRPVRMKRKKFEPIELATKNKVIRSEIHEDLKAINCDEGKATMSTKTANDGSKAVPKNLTAPVKNISKKKKAVENQISSKLNVTETLDDNVKPQERIMFDNQESDAESEISLGNASPVSSVHTSDLSSFDDEISLSSEDGDNGSKKKVSLRVLEKSMSRPGKFNGLLLKSVAEKENSKKSSTNKEVKSPHHQNQESSKKSSINKETKSPHHQTQESSKKSSTNEETKSHHKIQSSKKSSTKKETKSPHHQTQASPSKSDSISESADSATEVQSPSVKILPKRIRKPNSKYSSDNILCTIEKVKQRKKHNVEVRGEVKSSSDEINSKNVKLSCDKKRSSCSIQLSEKRIKSDASDSDAEIPSKTTKTVHVKEESDSDSELSSPLPQVISQQLYKPHFAVHSLTSRKTEPVTLYST